MRKSTLFLSATLTTFMLAVMFGVASAYQKIVLSAVAPTEAATQIQQAQPVAEQAKPVVMQAAPTASTAVIDGGTMTIEQAATLASNVIGRSDLYSAEVAQLDGVDTYLVTFSSGDIVYVSKGGQILSITKLPLTYISAPAASGWVGNGGGNNSGSSASSAGSAGNSSVSNGGEDSHEDQGDENEHEDGDGDD